MFQREMNVNIQSFDQKSVEGKFAWLVLNVEDRTLPSLCLPHLMRDTVDRVNYVSLRIQK